jgi:putative nucleotidyltransferase with HDIG domain
MNLDGLVKDACFAHSRQVSKISALLAQRAGYAQDEVMVIEQAALYHDIGKTDIPSEILNKPGALTQMEYEIVKTHTALGYERIAEAAKTLTIAAMVCREHHERPDGSGYSGMTATGIHPYSKLIAVADVFDALYSRRAYKESWGIPEIRRYFSEQSGTQFDAEIVQILLLAVENILALYREDEYA